MVVDNFSIANVNFVANDVPCWMNSKFYWMPKYIHFLLTSIMVEYIECRPNYDAALEHTKHNRREE